MTAENQRPARRPAATQCLFSPVSETVSKETPSPDDGSCSRRCLVALLTLLLPSIAPAHPLGNDSITHISILWILPDRVEFDLFLDFAEGPSQRYAGQMDANDDGEESTEEQVAWLQGTARECIPSLIVTIDGVTTRLGIGGSFIVPPNVVHGVKAITAGRLIDCFTPRRDDFL